MTYDGGQHGAPVDFLIRGQTMNPLVLLDEIDKLSDRHGSEMTGVLTHLLDATQSCDFTDDFVGVWDRPERHLLCRDPQRPESGRQRAARPASRRALYGTDRGGEGRDRRPPRAPPPPQELRVPACRCHHDTLGRATCHLPFWRGGGGPDPGKVDRVLRAQAQRAPHGRGRSRPAVQGSRPHLSRSA